MGRSRPSASVSALNERESSISSTPSPSSSSAPPVKIGCLRKIDEFDKKLSLRVHGGGLVVPRCILKLLEYSGDGSWSIPLTAALWLAPILLEKEELRSFLFNMFVALLFDLAFIGVIKSVIRRPRPVYNKGMYLVLSVDHYSFPSGHSSRALMVAALFWLNLSMVKDLLTSGEPIWENILQNVGYGVGVYVPALEICLAIALSAWALGTASSRILLGRHYVFDVLVGSLVGILEALFVHRVLLVPKNVSQGIHDLVMGVFRQA
ncbi:unnamed protein product [Calypogeia fissa]